MAIATGTAALIGSGIEGVSELFGASKAAGAAKAASEAQSRSASEAIAFEREKEMRRRQEYDQELQMKKEAYEAEQRRLGPYRHAAASVLARYGIQIPMEEEPAPAAAGPQAAPFSPQTPPAPLGPAPFAPGSTEPRQFAPAPDGGLQPMTLAQLARWNEWSNYGAQ